MWIEPWAEEPDVQAQSEHHPPQLGCSGPKL